MPLPTAPGGAIFKLPTELRELIYRKHYNGTFIFNGGSRGRKQCTCFFVATDRQKLEAVDLSLLQTCKVIYQEASRSLFAFANCRYIIDLNQLGEACPSGYQCSRLVQFRNIEIVLSQRLVLSQAWPCKAFSPIKHVTRSCDIAMHPALCRSIRMKCLLDALEVNKSWQVLRKFANFEEVDREVRRVLKTLLHERAKAARNLKSKAGESCSISVTEDDNTAKDEDQNTEREGPAKSVVRRNPRVLITMGCIDL